MVQDGKVCTKNISSSNTTEALKTLSQFMLSVYVVEEVWRFLTYVKVTMLVNIVAAVRAKHFVVVAKKVGDDWLLTLRRSSVFCSLSLIIRIFSIIYDVLQHYDDERCSPESWSSLLTSPLAENNGSLWAHQVLRQSVKKGCFKRQDNGRMFSGVLSCTDTKTQSWTTAFNQKRLFQML